ncbi:MAG TPA: aminotransferase class V-fold PLP-dependent enzyme, partial [Gemmatimonadaceae bacterium]|nr:aminotransferase class V-fold PLP-dependent enzyme [Gemmatimonadaceae bacterium]
TEVALTHSTSEGISIVAWSRNWERGDEVVISNQEHPANVFPWYQLRARFGIVIREIDLDAGTDVVAEVERVLAPTTRLVSLPHVSRNNGRRLTDAESLRLATLLRARGIRFLLDGAQAPGAVPVHFARLGADYYAACGHKWLLGPKGTGFLFVRRDVLDATQISWAGAHSTTSMDYAGHFALLPSAARFEFGTRALADFGGLLAAVRWMEAFGRERVEARVAELVGYAIERAHVAGLALASPEPRAERSGVFVIRLPAGSDAGAIYQRLATEQRILGSPVRREGDFRLSIHFFNTRAEIAAAISALAEAARSS